MYSQQKMSNLNIDLDGTQKAYNLAIGQSEIILSRDTVSYQTDSDILTISQIYDEGRYMTQKELQFYPGHSKYDTTNQTDSDNIDYQCITCGISMGSMNSRQYCGKTRCNDEVEPIINEVDPVRRKSRRISEKNDGYVLVDKSDWDDDMPRKKSRRC
jgi:hypothetical protein